jgi:hypothetical protein
LKGILVGWEPSCSSLGVALVFVACEPFPVGSSSCRFQFMSVRGHVGSSSCRFQFMSVPVHVGSSSCRFQFMSVPVHAGGTRPFPVGELPPGFATVKELRGSADERQQWDSRRRGRRRRDSRRRRRRRSCKQRDNALPNLAGNSPEEQANLNEKKWAAAENFGPACRDISTSTCVRHYYVRTYVHSYHRFQSIHNQPGGFVSKAEKKSPAAVQAASPFEAKGQGQRCRRPPIVRRKAWERLGRD